MHYTTSYTAALFDIYMHYTYHLTALVVSILSCACCVHLRANMVYHNGLMLREGV